jgi:hypothetical protein
MMSENWKETIHHQRQELAKLLHQPLATLAAQCIPAWGDRDKLNEVLLAGFAQIPHCTYLYVLDTSGLQICDNVSSDGIVADHYGRDRSQRPYMREAVPVWGFLLSDAYISLRTHRPSLTALHVIRNNDGPLGYLGADFDLRDLPATAAHYDEPAHWRQIKGDPSIRGTLFLQTRAESPMDRNMEQAFSILEELLTERGMFQGVIHFSSSRATVWFIDDPYRYRILDHEALADPDICLAYPLLPYPADALMPKSAIQPILEVMRELRLADEVLYLRSSSINIFNGMISLTFSCDGSHYMSWREFLDKDMSFWLGSAV